VIAILGGLIAFALGNPDGCLPRPAEVSPPPAVFGTLRPDAATDLCPPDRIRRSELPESVPAPRGRPAPPLSSYDCEAQGCWAWAGWADRREVIGAAAAIEVWQPEAEPDGHSLAEVAIRGGPELTDIVEIGWSVAPRANGDRQPHLFVKRWLDGTPCEGSCGFRPWSSGFAAGMDLSPWIGRPIRVGWLSWEGRWWAWFEGGWLGWFEAASWNVPYRRGRAAQWFGEVFFTTPRPSGSMGSGLRPPAVKAARIVGICDVAPGELACRARPSRLPRVADARVYGLQSESDSAFRYGGPGETASEVKPPPPPGAANAGTPPATETSAPSPPR
jgi:Neprosin